MKTLRSVYILDNGQVMVFDEKRQQVEELQIPLILLWAERAESLGYNVDKLRIEADDHSVVLHKTESGWNYSIK